VKPGSPGLFVRALLVLLFVAFGRTAHAEPAVSAAYVQGRLLAPCCWTQTLDIHESELATSLRAEVVTRVAAGEPAAAIEDDFAARYGERIRAIPRGRDPRIAVAFGSAAIALAALVGMGLALRRWVRREPASRTKDARPRPNDADDAYDVRLDEELRALDDA